MATCPSSSLPHTITRRKINDVIATPNSKHIISKDTTNHHTKPPHRTRHNKYVAETTELWTYCVMFCRHAHHMCFWIWILKKWTSELFNSGGTTQGQSSNVMTDRDRPGSTPDWRLTRWTLTDWRRIAVELGLPGNASREDTASYRRRGTSAHRRSFPEVEPEEEDEDGAEGEAALTRAYSA